MQNNSTHFVFNGREIFISRDLYPTVNFLQEIEKEVESFLWFDKKLKINHPIRSKIIVLFANLETLLRLNFAYKNKIDDGEKIRKQTLGKKTWEDFYNNFCLNKNNDWVKNNKGRASHITACELRYLRNSLTHFFSLDKGLAVSDSFLDSKSRKLEKTTSFKAKFISPEDLYEITKGSAMLMIKNWSSDCEECFKLKSNDFKDRILAVNRLIINSGAIVVKNHQINI